MLKIKDIQVRACRISIMRWKSNLNPIGTKTYLNRIFKTVLFSYPSGFLHSRLDFSLQREPVEPDLTLEVRHDTSMFPDPPTGSCQRSRMLPETQGRLVHLNKDSLRAGSSSKGIPEWEISTFSKQAFQFMPSLRSLLKRVNREAAGLLVNGENTVELKYWEKVPGISTFPGISLE